MWPCDMKEDSRVEYHCCHHSVGSRIMWKLVMNLMFSEVILAKLEGTKQNLVV